MSGFFGSYNLVLDAKGRINMPARYREMDENSGNGGHMFVIARGSDKCVAIYRLEEWERRHIELDNSDKTGKEKRQLKRSWNFYASHQKVDKQGRLNLPANLIEYAGLEKDIVLIGSGKHMELWNPKYLDEEMDSAEKENPQILDSFDS